MCVCVCVYVFYNAWRKPRRTRIPLIGPSLAVVCAGGTAYGGKVVSVGKGEEGRSRRKTAEKRRRSETTLRGGAGEIRIGRFFFFSFRNPLKTDWTPRRGVSFSLGIREICVLRVASSGPAQTCQTAGSRGTLVRAPPEENRWKNEFLIIFFSYQKEQSGEVSYRSIVEFE